MESDSLSPALRQRLRLKETIAHPSSLLLPPLWPRQPQILPS
jgi:hypothetical protein